jgi:hypothetical protein
MFFGIAAALRHGVSSHPPSAPARPVTGHDSFTHYPRIHIARVDGDIRKTCHGLSQPALAGFYGEVGEATLAGAGLSFLHARPKG